MVKYVHVLLVLALLSWVCGWAVLNFTATSDPLRNLFLVFVFIFVWANGLYWLILLRYPRVEVKQGLYASYDEWKGRDSRLVLAGYFVGAVLASITCVKLGLGG